MRNCLKTNEPINPVTNEHYFLSKEAFERFIDDNDPLDTVVTKKRNVKWKPRIIPCFDCQEPFEATHPAQMYCEKHRAKPNKGPRKPPISFYVTKEKACDKCNKTFLAQSPASKYCEKCSDHGGPLVRTKSDEHLAK